MAYDPASNPARKVADLGITGNSSGANAIFLYESSHSSTSIATSTAGGFFTGAGAGSRTPGAGMQLRDLVCCRESSAGTFPGKVTWHSVIGSTADQASTLAATGWGAAYNASISTYGISTN